MSNFYRTLLNVSLIIEVYNLYTEEVFMTSSINILKLEYRE
ncbi:hypothetical protein LLB_2277 [Legionella longbeachae D-4968]|nr:hypothetical protein LLB_2277 [Legionella longbeachae D-4968]